MAKLGEGGELLKCSFCGKSQKQVKKLIAGPGVYICDECIDLCNEIIDEELAGPSDDPVGDLPVPREIYAFLDDYIVGQESAKRSCRSRSTTTTAGATRREPGPRDRAPEVQHPADRPDRLRQDADGADARPDAQRALRHRRRHRPHRSGLRGRGCGEHSPQAHPGGGLRRKEGREGSSTSTRSTRSPARARTRRSPATYPGRASSRRCSRSWRAPRHRCLRRGAQAPPSGVHPD